MGEIVWDLMPRMSDAAQETLFNQIYDEFDKYFLSDDDKERLSVWISEQVEKAWIEGFKQGRLK